VDVTDRTDDAASFITPVSVLFSTFTRLNPAMGPDFKKNAALFQSICGWAPDLKSSFSAKMDKN